MEKIKVSDWSQPYKLAVYALAILGLAAFVWFLVVPWANRLEEKLDAGLVALNSRRTVVQQKVFGAPPYTVLSTNATSTASSTISLAIGSAPAIQKRTFYNGGAVTIFLFEASSSAGLSAGQGLALKPQQFYEETEALGNLWTGNVWQIVSAGTASTSISQF